MKFRRKPTVIDAVQYDGENEAEVYAAFGAENFEILGDSDGFMLAFTTGHGDQAFARPTDWIVPDSNPNTFYPIMDSVMQSSYEPFNYDEELTDESNDAAVAAKIKSVAMQLLPMSQVKLITDRLEYYMDLEA